MDAHVIINLFHIFIAAPFLLWIGIARSSIPDQVFMLLIGLGIFMIIYHGYKAYVKYFKGSNSIWVNVIHVVWVAPLLIYIGANKKETMRPAYELVLLTAFGALGYHLYELAAYTN